MSFGDFLNSTVDVYGKGDIRGIFGGMGRSAVIKQTGLKCRITDMGTAQAVSVGERMMTTTHKIYCKTSTIQNGDTVIETSPLNTGAVYRVTSTPQNRRASGRMPAFQVFDAVELSVT